MKKILIYLTGLFLLVGCEADLSDDAIPWQPFDVIQLNLNLPEYVNLKMEGTHMELNEGGVRGIILYHHSGSTYMAYERNCSYQPNSACATVGIDHSKLFMLCACCNSTFDFATGFPTSGIAWRPLRQYETSLNGSTLTITDQIVE